MQITQTYRDAALRAARQLTADATEGIEIPEMGGHFVIQRGRSPHPDTVQIVLKDDDGTEYEVYTNGSTK